MYFLTHTKHPWKRRASVLALAFSISAGSLLAPADSLAAGYDKVSDGVYQMLDGTSIYGVVSRGIDVSHWQGDIDWNQVAGDDISFVMLGTRYKGAVDPRFHENAAEAHAAGIQLGAYIYSYATDPAMAEAEADFILDLVKDYPISYPIAFDIEDSSQSSLSPSEISAIINAFCQKIEAAGYHPIVYANDYWLANKIDLSQMDYDVWVARYEVKHAFEQPVMWQATSTGSVNGIQGNVDIDFQYQDFSDVITPNLWRTINGTVYYYQNYQMQKEAWINDGTGWFYLNSTGQPATEWLNQNGTSYYLDPASGRMAQGWLDLGGSWYYFNESGAMQTGWIQTDTGRFYLNSDGVMQTGWHQDQNRWFYLKENGSMATGWRPIDNQWYYFDGNGIMQTGWIQTDTGWYRLNDSGQMMTGWTEDNGRWFYLNADGSMATGLIQDNGNLYYLNPADGVMAANTAITANGITYLADAHGICTPAPAEENAGTSSDGQTSPAGDSAGNANTDGQSGGQLPDNTTQITSPNPGDAPWGNSSNGGSGSGIAGAVDGGTGSPGGSGNQTSSPVVGPGV